jgi:hypothetical protein
MKQLWLIMAVVVCLFYMVSHAWSQEQKVGSFIDQQNPQVKPEETTHGVTGNVTLGVFSAYVSRGYEFGRHSVVFQPAMTVSYRGFSIGYWGNVDTNEHHTQNFTPDRDRKLSFNESDVTVSYSRSIGMASITGGWIYYATRYTDETQEVFGTVAFDIISKPTITLYRDFDRFPGTYITMSFGHSIPLGADVTLDLGASAAYMWGDGACWKTFSTATGDYSGPTYRAFHDGMVKVGLTVPVTRKLSVIPVIQYWFPLSGKAARHWGEDSYNPGGYLKTLLAGGVNITYSF